MSTIEFAPTGILYDPSVIDEESVSTLISSLKNFMPTPEQIALGAVPYATAFQGAWDMMTSDPDIKNRMDQNGASKEDVYTAIKNRMEGVRGFPEGFELNRIAARKALAIELDAMTTDKQNTGKVIAVVLDCVAIVFAAAGVHIERKEWQAARRIVPVLSEPTILELKNCQSALKIDPPSASKIDPPQVVVFSY